MFLMIIFVSILLPLNLSAGDEVGNGGDVIVCSKESSNPPKILDFYESREGDFSIEHVEGDDEYKIAKKVIGKLEKVSPKLMAKYLSDLKDFRLKVRMASGEIFRDIKDSNHIGIPKDCSLKQLAIQKLNPLTREVTIHINKDLYESLVPFQKAGIILHEIIYEHFLFFNVIGSTKVRLFNRYLFSKEIRNHDPSYFLKLSENLRIPLY